MRTLIIGDVHGCSFELRKMISIVQPSKVILVGDLFTKGPDPKGVWDLIQKHKMKAVLGNHDVALLSNKKKILPKRGYKYIENLPLSIELKSCIIGSGVGIVSFLTIMALSRIIAVAES